MRYLVIPAYEPDEKLLTLLQQLQGKPSLTIIVINDGSPACYNCIFQQASQYSTVLHHEHNQGKGRALKTGFSYIMELKNTLADEFVITADSDGQHTVGDILKVCKACEETKGTLITGERYFIGNVPLRSRLGNTITKYVFTLFTGLSLNDTQCGLRAFPTSLLPFLCRVKGERYEYEMNVLLEVGKNAPIKGVPIETVYIDGNRSSHFHPFKDSFKIYKEIGKFSISSILSFLVDYIFYAMFLLLFSAISTHTRLILSNVLSRICSATFNYSLNKSFVFKDKQNILKTGYKYGLLALFILLLNTLLLLFLHKIGLNNVYVAKILTECVLFLLSWNIQRNFIFRKKYLKKS